MQVVPVKVAAGPLRTAMQLGEASFDAVILLDEKRVPRWANGAARHLYAMGEMPQSGNVTDHYSNKLQVRYPGLFSPHDNDAHDYAEDCCVDVESGRIVCRFRRSALKDGEQLIGYAIVSSPVFDSQTAQPAARLRVDGLAHAAAVVRCRDGIVTSANEAFLAMTGRRGCTIAGCHISVLGIPAILMDTPEDTLSPTLSRLETPTGRTGAMLVDSRTELVNGEAFRVLTFSELDADLMASVLAHSLLDDGTAVSKLICGTVAAPMFVLDGERRVVAASDELLRLLSYDAADIVGRPIVEFLSESSIRFFKDVFWPSLGDCSLAEDPACELVASTGRKVQVRLTGRPVLGDDQAVRRATCVVEDLTERQLSELKFSTLFTLSPIPMLIRRLDDTTVLDVNPAFLSMTGYSSEEVAGRPMEHLAVYEPSHLRPRLERDLRAGVPHRGVDMRIKASDGSWLEMQANSATVQAFGQRSALMILHDPARGRFDEQQLFKAIETVMGDTSWFSRQVVEKLATVRTPRSQSVRQGELDDLTKREREVLAMISHGWSDAEIAARLSLTRSTVRNHVAALYSKIGVHSRSSAIVWARERALNVIHPAAGFGQQAVRRIPSSTVSGETCHG